MRQRASIIGTLVVVAATVLVVSSRLTSVQGQTRQEPRFAAVPGEKGGQDMFCAYDRRTGGNGK